MLKRSLCAGAVLLVVAACGETPSEPPMDRGPVMAETIVDGRPGQFAFDWAIIDPTDNDRCATTYTQTVNGNTFISNSSSRETTTIRIVENKNFVKAMCRFTDTSLVYEGNAEVGKISGCELNLPDGRSFTDGTGIVTAAANNAVGDGEDGAGNDGGNAMIHCTFPK